MNTNLTKFTKYILNIMFYSGIVVLVTLPLSLKYLGKYYSSMIMEHFLLMLIVFGISGICGLLIIYELRKMMCTVLNESCFVYENVKSLNHMSITSLCIIVMFIIKIVFLPTPATAVIILTFFIASLFSRVLAYVFAQAIDYKEENDLTI